MKTPGSRVAARMDSVSNEADQVVEIGGENPFQHRLQLNFRQVVQIAVMSVTLAPLRLTVFFIVLFLCYLLSLVGLVGVNKERLAQMPLSGWRRNLQDLVYFVARGLYFAMGIHWIRLKGNQAASNEAPILVAAPHATFVDSLAIVKSRAMPVAKAEFERIPFLGKIGLFMQVLMVQRESEESCKSTVNLIKRHVNVVKNTSAESGVRVRQLLLFPEGTCTNGRALIHFKAGAFQPSAPVQPVAIRFRAYPDTLTWTWDQEYGAAACLWLTMCQLHTGAEIEFLPVYHPSKAECSDPRVFARGVRAALAASLRLPMLDRRLEDGQKAAASKQSSSDDNFVIVPRCLDFAGNLTLIA